MWWMEFGASGLWGTPPIRTAKPASKSSLLVRGWLQFPCDSRPGPMTGSYVLSGASIVLRVFRHAHNFWIVTMADTLCFSAACHVRRVVESRIHESVYPGWLGSG